MEVDVPAGAQSEAAPVAVADELRARQGAAHVAEAGLARGLAEPPRHRDQHARRLRAPQTPVVAAGEEAVADVGAGGVQLVGERADLRRAAPVGPALQQPRAQSQPVDPRGQRRHVVGGAVRGQLGGRRARERPRRGLDEVARPALDHAERRQVAQPDVERAVGALRQTGDRPVTAVGERHEALVDVAHHVHHVVGPTAVARVRPLVVVEQALLPGGHDEDHRTQPVLGDQRVHAHLDRVDVRERRHRAGRAVQQVQDAEPVAGAVARGQVDEVAALALHRRRVEAHRLQPPPGDAGGRRQRREAAPDPVVVHVRVGRGDAADEPRGRYQDHDRAPHTPDGRPPGWSPHERLIGLPQAWRIHESCHPRARSPRSPPRSPAR